MIDEKILLLITDELTGQLSEDEKGILSDWLQESKENRNHYHVYKEVFLNGGYIATGLSSEKVYAKLSQRLNFSDQPSLPKHSDGYGIGFSHGWYKRQWFKIAATLAIFITVSFTVFQLITDKGFSDPQQTGNVVVKSNPIGVKTLITLPDGSKVKLNSESFLEYNSNFDEGRAVKLVGEAFFEVVKDSLRPFSVNSGNLNIEVLGTSFNVEAFPFEEDIRVALVTGKVQINQLDGLRLKPLANLGPDEMLVYNHQTTKHQVILFEVESIVGWVDGTLVFVEEQMTEVIKELERWYGVEIIIAPGVDLSGRINGKYTNAPLDVVLKGIGFTSDFSFEMEGKAVYINK